MRGSLRLLLTGSLAVGLGQACGSEVVAPSGPVTAASVTSSTTGSGGSSTTATSTSSGETSPCAEASCGEPCVVCNDVECLEGICDASQSCAPFEEVDCGSGGAGGEGGAGGAFTCPPPADVQMGEPCEGEGATCPSANSCSGVLDCSEGVWVLFQLC